jgi:choline dehydrogenase-like flavoprotein
MTEQTYDAIVVGSGITGGWAAKELAERGLRVLMIERGPEIRHGDYPTEHAPVYDFKFRLLGDKRRYAERYPHQSSSWFFNEGTERYWVDDVKNPYTTPADKPFSWIRGHHLGGRSLMWGRQSYRWAPRFFEENQRDGHGVDWPIRYDDLDPWYAHVERFIGVSGTPVDHPMAPNGVYQPAYPMNAAEIDLKKRVEHVWPDRVVTMGRAANLTRQLGDDRSPCHYCGPCERGCSVGAYFSTQSSTLPAAVRTGRLTVAYDAIVAKVLTNPEGTRATGVEVMDANTRVKRSYQARMVFLCASAFESVRLLMMSASDRHPAGLGNSSGVLGRYVMDHFVSDLASVSVEAPQYPHLTGYRPMPLFIPRFRNVNEKRDDYVRGYMINSGAAIDDWSRGTRMPGVGAAFKNALRKTGNWSVIMVAQCEPLPLAQNRISLDPDKRDAWGMPALHIDVARGDNDEAMRKEAGDACFEMLNKAGYADVARVPMQPVPGSAIHEMGGAPMGRDPRTSVLDAHSRSHDIPNLFVTDGAAMASASCVNPSLTYMAITARAAAFAAAEAKAGRL